MNHPNVCQIYEIGEDGGVLFIAMELLEGQLLSGRLKQGPLNVADTVSIGLSILAALCRDGRTILLVEQNARSGLAIAHNGAVLDAGTVHLVAPASELLNSPDVGRLYLGAS